MSDLIFNVASIFDAETRQGCLQQYNSQAYRIPPYQRGYKWGSGKEEPVERLLSDLTKAWNTNAKEYLLQAITIKKAGLNGEGQVLEVIDGQQRLTTLYILLCTLRYKLNKTNKNGTLDQKLRYSIRHEDYSLEKLIHDTLIQTVGIEPVFDSLMTELNIDDELHQDAYYLKAAILRCFHHVQTGLENSEFTNATELEEFHGFVCKDVKLMVNAVEPYISGEVIFGNLNSNRVPLTETELIKGLLLTRVARESAADAPHSYRETLEMRIQLGQKWDELHHWANHLEYKSLFFPAHTDGITGLLEMVAMQMTPRYTLSAKSGKNPLFEFFLQQSSIEPVFRLLSATHARLQDWYADIKTYNLLGYCLMKGNHSARQSFLVQCLNCKTHPEFEQKLKQARKAMLGLESSDTEEKSLGEIISSLRYGEHDSLITNCLLAVSIFQDASDEPRFNFHAYQSEKWSLEHIFPQSPFGKGANLTNEQKKEALEILSKNKGELLSTDTMKEMKGLADSSMDDDALQEIDDRLKHVSILHQIGNMCLLSSSDNASVGCGMFNVKRKKIRDRIAQGSFVPRHTYEVFSKMIVGEEGGLDIWSALDIEKHQEQLQARLQKILDQR